MGTISLVGAGFFELFPAFEGLVEVGHVGHRAAGAEVREDHADVFVGEDVGAISAMKWTPQKTTYSMPFWSAALRESSKLSPVKSAKSMTASC